MKTILVPVGGSDSDKPVFATALAAARPFAAHLDFVHVKIGPGEAAPYIPHVGFARGAALTDALTQLEAAASTRAAAAARHVRALCQRERIVVQDVPAPGVSLTASWREEADNAEQRLIRHARHHDLVVMTRARAPNGLPPDLLESLLLLCGRPILLAPSKPPRNLTGTVMVCWRETPEAARALTAAMPFLTHARRVVFVGVDEAGNGLPAALADLAAQFSWTGVRADVRIVPAAGTSTPAALAAAADECEAGLIVLGAYGRMHMREVIFGGCTQSFIEHADRPVLMMH
jgi:nucleotide-binding universal stress UspA family protein